MTVLLPSIATFQKQKGEKMNYCLKSFGSSQTFPLGSPSVEPRCYFLSIPFTTIQAPNVADRQSCAMLSLVCGGRKAVCSPDKEHTLLAAIVPRKSSSLLPTSLTFPALRSYDFINHG